MSPKKELLWSLWVEWGIYVSREVSFCGIHWEVGCWGLGEKVGT